MKKKFVVWLLSSCLVMTNLVFAADPATESNASIQDASSGDASNKSLTCPDAELWGQKMITGICWSCIFPIRVGGGLLKVGDNIEQRAPDDATTKTLCTCPSSVDNPVPIPGITASYWEPTRAIEVVRTPFCMPMMAGTKIKDSWRGMGTRGHNSSSGSTTDQHHAFYNVHFAALPLLAMLDLIVSVSCNSDGYLDFDLLYLTEFDPTWTSDELSLLVSFETIVFANPVSLAACAVDAAAATAGYPIKQLFWCAGAWGPLYPLTGNMTRAVSPPETTSLLSARFLAKLHRLGLARKTVGTEALCKAPFYPTLHKTQYKMSTFFPVVEAKKNHWIGQHTFTWGEWRNIPAAGEDFVYILYRYNECCYRIGP